MEMRPKVYVTQEMAHCDYSQAEDYGDVVFLAMDDLPTVQASLRAKSAIKEIKERFAKYKAGHDYILASGSPVNAAAVTALAGRYGDEHNLLKWNNRSRKYSVVKIDLRD